VQEGSAGGTVPSDLRSRGLCLVPISCTDRVARDGHGNGAGLWSVAVPARVGGNGAALPGGHPGHLP
jgi:hypothetical protein